jgi:hypothetical protein
MLLAIAGALTTVTAAQASTEFSTERLVGYVVGAPPPDTLRALV